jgi:hypothetical protein
MDIKVGRGGYMREPTCRSICGGGLSGEAILQAGGYRYSSTNEGHQNSIACACLTYVQEQKDVETTS